MRVLVLVLLAVLFGPSVSFAELLRAKQDTQIVSLDSSGVPVQTQVKKDSIIETNSFHNLVLQNPENWEKF